MSVTLLSATWNDESLDGVCLLVMMSLSDWANEGGYVASIRTRDIARRARCSDRTVHKHISDLESRGYIKTIDGGGNRKGYVVYPNGHPDNFRSLVQAEQDKPRQSDGAEDISPRKNCGDSTLVPRRTCGVEGANPAKLSVSKSALAVSKTQIPEEMGSETPISTVYVLNKTERKEEHIRLKSNFGADDWQTKYAAAFWAHLDKAGLLPPRLKEGSVGDRDATLAKWADELDRLVRLDKYKPEDILAVAKWLFQDGNWWTESGNIRSVRKFRRRNDADEMYFDIMFAQMKGSSRITFDTDGVLTESQMKELCRVRGLTESDFWRRGTDTRTGEPIYQLRKNDAA